MKWYNLVGTVKSDRVAGRVSDRTPRRPCGHAVIILSEYMEHYNSVLQGNTPNYDVHDEHCARIAIKLYYESSALSLSVCARMCDAEVSKTVHVT